VDLSGIIFVVLALAWAFYLVPKAVKHHDEVARTRSVDRFSTAMRVLARREPVDPRNARLVVTPPRSAERVVVPSRPVGEHEPAAEAVGAPRRRLPAARRAAARAAARRRRRVTLVLVVADLVTVVLAAFALASWWTVAVPVALTLLYLVLCRHQVRRENDATWSSEWSSASGTTPPRRAVRVDAAYGSVQVTAQDSRGSAEDDTVQIPVTDSEAVPVSVETADGGSLWDPLPVTLPTYVNKARASRTVRTIDLGAPGTWTSGRDEADSALVGESTATEAVQEPVEHEQRRAVGS
jgi:hypothetical protein